MLCANCHREVHDGSTVLPQAPQVFNSQDYDYHGKKRERQTESCPVCDGDKAMGTVTCSAACASKIRERVRWADYDLIEMSKTLSNVKIAKVIGVSARTIAKRIGRLARETGLEPVTDAE